jgi:[acyl-carrier-protein] S-malonyltransferase
MRAAVIFPGQGSQYEGMADPWMDHAAGREALDEASKTLERDVVELCRDEEALRTTEHVQPCLLACDVAAFRVLAVEGARFQAGAGHSLGELAALVASGVLDLASALRFVIERGRAMQEAADLRPGAMTALLGVTSVEAVQICEASRGDGVLAVANENAPKQVVLSGSVEAVERAERDARSRGAKAIRLRVAGAFHSPLMEPAVGRIREAAEEPTFEEPAFPIVANVTADLVRDPSAFRELLGRHVVSTVRWEGSIRTLAEAGFDTFVEAGPGDVLSKLVRRTAPRARVHSVGGSEAAVELARMLAREVMS